MGCAAVVAVVPSMVVAVPLLVVMIVMMGLLRTMLVIASCSHELKSSQREAQHYKRVQ